MTSPAADPVFTTATDALKAVREEHAAEIAAHVPPTFEHRSRLRHWWESKKGEWRMQLRAWLGITELDETVSPLVIFAEDHVALVEGLRRDLDAVAKASTDVGILHKGRLDDTDKNLEELRRQFHFDSKRLDNALEILQALRTVPMNQVAVRKFAENKRIQNDRRARRQRDAAAGVAGSIAPQPAGEGTVAGVPADIETLQKALVSGEQKPDGEGWEAVYCQSCGKIAGWWDSKQVETSRPASAWCVEHSADAAMPPAEPEMPARPESD